MRLSDLQISSAYTGLFIGILQMTISILAYPDGGYYWDFPIPAWGEMVLFFVGLCITLISMRAILRGEGKPKKVEYTDEDVAKAKAEMDRIYLKKYGKLPDYPQESQGEAPGPESKKDGPEPKP